MSKIYEIRPKDGAQQPLDGSVLVNKEYLEEVSNKLLTAADLIAFWGHHAKTYHQEKHDLAGDIERVKTFSNEMREYL